MKGKHQVVSFWRPADVGRPCLVPGGGGRSSLPPFPPSLFLAPVSRHFRVYSDILHHPRLSPSTSSSRFGNKCAIFFCLSFFMLAYYGVHALYTPLWFSGILASPLLLARHAPYTFSLSLSLSFSLDILQRCLLYPLTSSLCRYTVAYYKHTEIPFKHTPTPGRVLTQLLTLFPFIFLSRSFSVFLAY